LALTITAIVCAFNEAYCLPACLFSLLAQTRPPDEILVVNNASTDATAAVAQAVPGVRVIDEPTKGLVVARERARRRGTRRRPRVRGRRLPRAHLVDRTRRAALRVARA
jgi:glycosyltransferase involved in cell wall biosynthesis